MAFVLKSGNKLPAFKMMGSTPMKLHDGTDNPSTHGDEVESIDMLEGLPAKTIPREEGNKDLVYPDREPVVNQSAKEIKRSMKDDYKNQRGGENNTTLEEEDIAADEAYRAKWDSWKSGGKDGPEPPKSLKQYRKQFGKNMEKEDKKQLQDNHKLNQADYDIDLQAWKDGDKTEDKPEKPEKKYANDIQYAKKHKEETRVARGGKPKVTEKEMDDEMKEGIRISNLRG